MSADLDALQALLDAATPGPWFWWGNTDNHSVALCGRQPGLGVAEVLSTISIERDPHGRDAQRLRQDLNEYFECSVEQIEDAVNAWAFDEYGEPRSDNRLSITDEKFIRRDVEELVVYEVARNQGLPDDTPRDHPKVYRADVVDVRATNASLIVAAVNALPDLLAEVRELRAAVERVRGLHRRVGVYAACPDDGCDRDDCYEGTDMGTFYHELEDDGAACKHCYGDLGDEDHEYPCPTIRVLGGES